jgi:mannose-6-phosphate isomerase
MDPSGRLGPAALTAVGDRPIFPLLVKLIDASENLSIQVHPDDPGAAALDRLGKTEAWHILAADPGSVLYLGLQPGVSFGAFQEASSKLNGSSAVLMRTVPAQAGTTVLIPAGTVHALGAGVMVYEVQQPSDVTFRLDDWGRVDAQGNPREMHMDAGLAVARPELRPELIPPVSLRPTIGEHHLLTACRYFSLERVALPAGAWVEIGTPGSPVVITILQGSGRIDELIIGTGSSSVVWPTSTRSALFATSPMTVLIAQVPDLAIDVIERAGNAGAETRAIGALGGATGDILAAIAR